MSDHIRQWFSKVTQSRVKIITEPSHEGQNIDIHADPYIFSFLARYS